MPTSYSFASPWLRWRSRGIVNIARSSETTASVECNDYVWNPPNVGNGCYLGNAADDGRDNLDGGSQ